MPDGALLFRKVSRVAARSKFSLACLQLPAGGELRGARFTAAHLAEVRPRADEARTLSVSDKTAAR